MTVLQYLLFFKMTQGKVDLLQSHASANQGSFSPHTHTVHVL